MSLSPARGTSPTPGRRKSSLEEQARLRQEERDALEAAQRVQRMAQVEALVAKRTDNFAYLKEMHGAGGFWLNVVLLRREDLQRFHERETPPERVKQLFYLGLSLGKILDVPAGAASVQAVLQLIEEWEYWMAGATAQGMKWMLARSSPTLYAKSLQPRDPDEPVKAGIYKFNQEVAYEHLFLPAVGIELDYFAVVISLCETLGLIYNKFLGDDCYSNVHVFDALLRMDAKIKHHLVNHLAKEYTELSIRVVEAEMLSLRG